EERNARGMPTVAIPADDHRIVKDDDPTPEQPEEARKDPPGKVRHRHGVRAPPNGSRLSCGASAGGRKRSALRHRPAGAQTLASSESRPGSFKRLLGGFRPDIVTQRPCLEKKASHASTTSCAQVRGSNRGP